MKQLKRNIAIVCGGDSSEHDVSLRSAQGLYSFFDKERYNVYIVDIKGQDWHVELPGGMTARMIHSLRAYNILKGTRGKKGINERKYAEIIVRLSTLLRFATEIKEMDINPLLADDNDVIAVDARILIEK